MIQHQKGPASDLSITSANRSDAFTSRTLSESRTKLLLATPDQLSRYDLAEMNLLMACGLHGAEDLDIPSLLGRVDEWAAKVAAETERKRSTFRPNPSCPTDARYRGYMLIKTLRDEFGLKHYLLPEKGHRLRRRHHPVTRRHQRL